MCGGWGTVGICSPVSPGETYYINGICGDPESGLETEDCLCWVDPWIGWRTNP